MTNDLPPLPEPALRVVAYGAWKRQPYQYRACHDLQALLHEVPLGAEAEPLVTLAEAQAAIKAEREKSSDWAEVSAILNRLQAMTERAERAEAERAIYSNAEREAVARAERAEQDARMCRLDYEQALIGALNECAVPRGLHAKIRDAFWLRVDAAIAQEQPK